MRFPIWERFSPEARKAAATAEYCAGRVTPDGCCPLGVACRVDNVPLCLGLSAWTAPTAQSVAMALMADDYDDGSVLREEEATWEAAGFIAMWDGRQIDPAALPALLEVE